MAKRDELVMGLDIGTTKICCIVGEVMNEGVDIVGIGTHPSKGLRKGAVINIESTVNSIRKAVEEAELMAGCEITSVFAGIAGGHIRGLNSHGIVAIKDKEVTPPDVERVIDAAQAVSIPLDREVIHVVPQQFIVDDQDGVSDPVGMSGVRLEAKVHIVTGAVTSAQNIIKCCNRAGLNVNDIILQQLASAEAVISDDEKDLGVVLLDIGGGTTDIALFSQGSIVHTSVLTIGGNHLTNDVAVGLRTPAHEAEKIKQRYGSCMTGMVHKDETIEVPSVGGRAPRVLSRQILAEILEPRMEEIFNLAQQDLARSGYEDMVAAGVVLTGGTTLLEGGVELSEQVFNLPVRRGLPKRIGGLVDVVNNPMYSTGVGLVMMGSASREEQRFKIRDRNIYSKVKGRMKEFLGEIL
jgi:cell division protein FtsA